MKTLAIIAFAASLYGQQSEPTVVEKELLAKVQMFMVALDRQTQQIDQQSRQIAALQSQIVELREQLAAPAHRKSVTVLLRTLTVVDHAGSVASIYSVIPHH